MIRNSNKKDILQVAKIYDAILEKDALGTAVTGWQKGVYPLQKTALEAHNNKELFVMEVADEIVASAIINQKQVREYANCKWGFCAQDSEVMVIHTLVVDPQKSGKGYAAEFVLFYEDYALKNGCRYLRLDTNEINLPARRLYQKLGYREAGVVSCTFNGIEGVRLVCLEKKLD